MPLTPSTIRTRVAQRRPPDILLTGCSRTTRVAGRNEPLCARADAPADDDVDVDVDVVISDRGDPVFRASRTSTSSRRTVRRFPTSRRSGHRLEPGRCRAILIVAAAIIGNDRRAARALLASYRIEQNQTRPGLWLEPVAARQHRTYRTTGEDVAGGPRGPVIARGHKSQYDPNNRRTGFPERRRRRCALSSISPRGRPSRLRW